MSKFTADSLTLEQKMNLLTGSNGWSIHTFGGLLPEVTVSDGPNGLRKHIIDENSRGMGTYKSIAYPTVGALSNSWDKCMVRKVASLIAEECIEHNVQVLLAPAVNIKRTPYCGRNFEYMSEDPYLAGTLAKEYIDGAQSKGVGTSLKHFAANNSDYDRHYINNEIDERALREIYLKVFEIALKANPATVMCSYNPLNGVYASENKKLLDGYLRKAFGYDGVIVSDWFAVNDRAKSLKATLDLEMPHSDRAFGELKAALERGYITEEEINASAERLVGLINRLEEMKPLRKADTSVEDRRKTALIACAESIVLLKNENVLPLCKTDRIAVVGPYAANPPTSGGGSGKVECETNPRSLVAELSDFMPNASFSGPDSAGNSTHVGGLRKDIENAYNSDTSVVVVGNDAAVETEGYDRYSCKLSPWMEDFILRVAQVSKKTVVVLHAGSYIDMSAWIDKVQGVVFCGFGGQTVNKALAGLLSGKYNFSAKLSETFPADSSQLYCRKNLPSPFCESYDEGIMVGYRYYDTIGGEVLYPFGHGLSYSRFEYSDLEVVKNSETEYTVSYSVTNASDTDGAEISQLYVADPICMSRRPAKELKGYSRDFIPAHATKRITLSLDKSAFAYYSTAVDGWYIENGAFEIMIGASSRDIRLAQRIDINLPYDEQAMLGRTRG